MADCKKRMIHENQIDYQRYARCMLKELKVLEKMAQDDSRVKIFNIDNCELFGADLQKSIDYLNESQNVYRYEVSYLYNGNTIDLVVTDIAKDKIYQALPKPRTKEEVQEYITQRYSSKIANALPESIPDKMTEAEYQKRIEGFTKVLDCVQKILGKTNS